MVAIVFSAVTAYISREVMLILHKKGEQFTSALLLRITKFATVKSMSDETVEIQGGWEAIRHIHELLLRACEENIPPPHQQLPQCSILDDMHHQKKDHSHTGYPQMGMGQMPPPRLDDPGYPVHPSTSQRDISNTNLFQDVTGGNQHQLYPMDNTHHQPPKAPEKSQSQFFDDLNSRPDSEDTIHKCPQCNYTSPKKQFLRDHMKRMHGEVRFHCTLCDAKYRIKKNLNRHIKSAHTTGTGVLFRCDSCSYTTQSQKAMDDHKLRLHRYRNHDCTVCHKAFGMKKDLLRHMKIHEHNAMVCTICKKSYSTKWYLKQHMKCHEPNFIKPRHYCRHCTKEFASLQILNNHIAAVHQGRRAAFSCKMCGQSFSKKKNLLKHELEHETDKPYKCDECRKKFRYHTSLARHKLTHRGENDGDQLSCPICNKVFPTEEELKTHSDTHLNDFKHECPTCHKVFTQKQALQRHERVHTGDKPYACDVCGKKFSDSSILRRHRINKHPETQEEKSSEPTLAAQPVPSTSASTSDLPVPATIPGPLSAPGPPQPAAIPVSAPIPVSQPPAPTAPVMPENDKYQQAQHGPADMSLGSMTTMEPSQSISHRMASALHIPQLSGIHDVSLHHSQGPPLLSDLGLRLAQVHNVGSQGFGVSHSGMHNPQPHMTNLQNNNLMGTNMQPQYPGYPQCMMSTSTSGSLSSSIMSHEMKK